MDVDPGTDRHQRRQRLNAQLAERPVPKVVEERHQGDRERRGDHAKEILVGEAGEFAETVEQHSPTRNATTMPTPPPLGVGRSCALRASGVSITRIAIMARTTTADSTAIPAERQMAQHRVGGHPRRLGTGSGHEHRKSVVRF